MLGYIGSFPIPEVISGINATILGAQIDQPEHQDQDHLGEHLVRSGQGSRRRQGAARPGRRRHHAAHRLARRRCRSPRERGMLRVRPGLRHDQVRPEDPAHRRSSTTGGRTTSSASRPRSTAPGSPDDTWDGLKDKMVVMAPYTNMPDDVKKLARRPKPRSSPARCIRSSARSRAGRQGSRVQRRRESRPTARSSA